MTEFDAFYFEENSYISQNIKDAHMLELIRAIEYAHLRNVRVFVTLNTLLNEFEIDNALKMADFYYESCAS